MHRRQVHDTHFLSPSCGRQHGMAVHICTATHSLTRPYGMHKESRCSDSRSQHRLVQRVCVNLAHPSRGMAEAPEMCLHCFTRSQPRDCIHTQRVQYTSAGTAGPACHAPNYHSVPCAPIQQFFSVFAGAATLSSGSWRCCGGSLLPPTPHHSQDHTAAVPHPAPHATTGAAPRQSRREGPRMAAACSSAAGWHRRLQQTCPQACVGSGCFLSSGVAGQPTTACRGATKPGRPAAAARH
jgi:hypothetical protein